MRFNAAALRRELRPGADWWGLVRKTWRGRCPISTFSGASEREAQGRANLLHPLCAQVGDAASQSRLGHGNSVVQIDSATALHSVIDIQNDFGRHAANGRRDGRDGYG